MPNTLPPVVWTLQSAREFLQSISAHLHHIGASAEIVGSVATKGESRNDLDLLLKPLRPMTLESILEAICEHLLPKISTDKDINPLESASHADEWFVNIALHDGRIVELYMAEADFPLVP